MARIVVDTNIIFSALVSGKESAFAEAPNIIAQAVFAGHLAARELDEEKIEGTSFKVERISIP